jgi:glyoxylase-like metal-dependent hydrolase (beta-lactamase superfamily II)
MAEPPAVAEKLQEVVPGVFHWSVENTRIGGVTSASHAVRTSEGESVLIDPVRLDDDALETLTPVSAIVVTAATHQRASWRYRRQFGVPVYLPRGSRATEEAPDEHYGAGDTLPGGLEAVHTPGPEEPHYTLLKRDARVLFCPDLVMVDRGELVFVPGEYHEDPNETRRSVERLLELPFDVLCLDHGPPLLDDPKESLVQLLAVTKVW